MVHSESPSDFHFPTNVELTAFSDKPGLHRHCLHSFYFDEEQEAGRAELSYLGRKIGLLAGILAASARIPVVFISSK